MLICLHCRKPFLFRLSDYPDYLVSPMANRIVSQVIEKCCPQIEAPNPVRRDADEIARALRFGVFTGKSSLRSIINTKLKQYFKWQRKWCKESRFYLGGQQFARFSDLGYTPTAQVLSATTSRTMASVLSVLLRVQTRKG